MASVRPTIYPVSLGCPKNLTDTEALVQTLADGGFDLAEEADGADVLLINTCGFIRAAEEESLETVAEYLALKKEGKVGAVVVYGCLVARKDYLIPKKFPEVDLALGLVGPEALLSALRELQAKKGAVIATATPSGEGLIKLTLPHFAYLKVCDGCFRSCAFCTIPSFRGPLRSRPLAEIQSEFEALIAAGVKEVALVGQDISVYGADQGESPNGLEKLLRELLRTPGDYWIRLLYLYPSSITDGLLDLVASEPRLCKYLDIPLQHASDRILKLMRRGMTGKDLSALYHRCLQRVPGVVLRSTVMVGFPGESKEEFGELLQFLSDHPFQRLGGFAYSKESGTAAADLPGQLGPSVAQKRLQILMDEQEERLMLYHESLVGQRRRFIIDDLDDEGAAIARTQGETPEIDPVFHLDGENLEPGTFIEGTITAGGKETLLAEAD